MSDTFARLKQLSEQLDHARETAAQLRAEFMAITKALREKGEAADYDVDAPTCPYCASPRVTVTATGVGLKRQLNELRCGPCEKTWTEMT